MGSIKEVEIYSLSDPRTCQVKYIGKANDSNKRLASHIRDSRRRNTPVYIWIRELIECGLKPILQVVNITSELEWPVKETEIISEYRSLGVDLLNVSKGGNQPFCSKEQRAINGRIVANKIHSNEKSKRIWTLKKTLFTTLDTFLNLGEPEMFNRLLNKLQSRPDLFPRSLTIKHL